MTEIGIDLRENCDFDLNNDNRMIVEQLKLLVTQIEHQIIWAKDAEEKQKHRYRLTQIKKAAGLIENFHEKITSGKQAQTIKGIGKGIGQRIDEIIATGTLVELTERQYVTNYTRIIMELTQITGIGEVKAQQLVDTYGVQGVADLREKIAKGELKVAKNQLTHHIIVGLKYYEDLKTKIPRSETEIIETKILIPTVQTIDANLQIQVCGSYRRRREFSGDIDVLMTHPDLVTDEQVRACPKKYLIMYTQALRSVGFIVDSLTEDGHTKYMGVCKLDAEHSGRRIDIRFVPYECWAAGILYFTGSCQFNKIFRGIANEKGYTVNEYGIYHFKDRKKGDRVSAFTEQDIFRIVGVKYLEPWKRDMRIASA